MAPRVLTLRLPLVLLLVYTLIRSNVDIGAHRRFMRGLLNRYVLPVELSVMSPCDTPLVIMPLGSLSHVISSDVLIYCDLATAKSLMVVLTDLVFGEHLEFLMPSSIARTVKLLVVTIWHHDL
jgi:hypothetical protein